MTQIPAGWYPDPAPQTAPGRLRYWDGQQWTAHLHDQQPVEVPPYPAATTQPYGGPPARTTPDGVPLAGWWRRVLARVLDGFIVIPLNLLAISPVVASQWDELRRWFDDLSYAAEHHTTEPPAPDLFNVTTGPGAALLVAVLVAYVLYETLFLLWKQATPGKLLVGLRVRRRATPDLPASSVLGRVGFVLLGQLCGVLLVLDYLWPLWDAKRQALHDKVAGTNVVLAPARATTTAGLDPATAAGLPPRW